MNYIEKLYRAYEEEPTPQPREYLDNQTLRDKLEDKVEELAGEELMAKFMEAQWEYLDLECQRFFLCGIRFGLELLRLKI